MSSFALASMLGQHSAGYESAEIEAAPDAEEMSLLIEESSQEQAAIQQDVSDAIRLEDQAVGMESLADAAERVTEATDTEIMLAEAGAELATAGVDAEVEMFPNAEGAGLESFLGRRIPGVEGLREMAKNFFEAIKRLLARIGERLLKFWRSITNQVPGVIKQARKLEARADAVRGKVKDEAKIKVTSEVKSLTVDGEVIKTASGLIAALGTLEGVVKDTLTVYPDAVVSAGEKIADAVNKFDLAKPVVSLSNVNKQATPLVKASRKFLTASVSGDKRFAQANAARTAHLLGNVTIYGTSLVEDLSTDSAKVLGSAQVTRSMSIALHASQEKPKDTPNEASIETFTPNDCEKVADKVVDICNLIKEFQDKYQRKLETSRGKIKAGAESSGNKIDDETSQLAMKAWQSATQYNTAYAKWSASPFTQLVSQALTVCRAAISVGNKSLSQYKDAK